MAKRWHIEQNLCGEVTGGLYRFASSVRSYHLSTLGVYIIGAYKQFCGASSANVPQFVDFLVLIAFGSHSFHTYVSILNSIIMSKAPTEQPVRQ